MELIPSTKKSILSVLNECDNIIKEFTSSLSTNEENINPIKLLDMLLKKHNNMKALIPRMNEDLKIQKKLDYLQSEIAKRDKMILGAQMYLRKSEIILSCALYYSRKKLKVVSAAVANPIDPEEVVRFGHKLTTKNGVLAPHDWGIGDKRRPYPTEDIWKRGFLRFVEDDGEWSPGIVDYVAETRLISQQQNASEVSGSPMPNAANTPVSMHLAGSPSVTQQIRPITPGSSNLTPNQTSLQQGASIAATPPVSTRPNTTQGGSGQQDDVGLITDSSNSSDSEVYT